MLRVGEGDGVSTNTIIILREIFKLKNENEFENAQNVILFGYVSINYIDTSIIGSDVSNRCILFVSL